MLYLIAFLTAIAAYLIGSISGSIIISKAAGKGDIRESGSKNAGTTNMLRVHGKKLAVLTLLIDVLKGVLAVLLGIFVDYILTRQYGMLSLIRPDEWVIGAVRYIAAIFVVLGHDYPIYFGFRGGKGVATSIGVAIMLDWKIGLVILIASLIIMLATRYVSLGSVIGAVIYPCIVAAFMLGKGEFDVSYLICAVILGILIIAKHKQNIIRLKNGTENKLSFKKNKQEA